MANTFRSQRLVYRAVEENDDDKAFLHSLVTDSENFANFDPQLLKPFSRIPRNTLLTSPKNSSLSSSAFLSPRPNSGGRAIE
jgi:hypothetical protein